MKDAFTSGAKTKLASNAGGLGVGTAFRSAGPLWSEAAQVVPDLFKRYWETGVMSVDAKQIAEASFVNPTFAYAMSGDSFPCHYGTDPLLSYHLATAFAPTSAGSRDLTKTREIYAVVKGQFHQWCISFSKSLRVERNAPKIIIRFFVGDAIHFGRALQCHAVNQSIFSGVYVRCTLECH